MTNQTHQVKNKIKKKQILNIQNKKSNIPKGFTAIKSKLTFSYTTAGRTRKRRQQLKLTRAVNKRNATQ